MTQPHPRPVAQSLDRDSKIWLALFGAVLIWTVFVLSSEITRPWINGSDYNGAVWSQAAHNTLRAGLAETSGASTAFYFGPLPIPAWGYYLHHPPLLHLAIAFLFAIFGEHEWVARLLPALCSLLSLIFLWRLVRSCASARAATLSAAVFASLPMQLRYGSMVNFEPCVLTLILGALWCLRCHHLTGRSSWKYGALGFVIVGLWVDWAMYLFVIALCACWLLRANGGDKRFALILVLSASLSGALYLTRIIFLRPDAWHDLSQTFMVRLGAGKGGHFTEWQWLTRIASTLTTHFLFWGLILAAIGALLLWRNRSDNDGLRWLGRAAVSIFVMDVLFVGVFQNDSYIHEYIAFYFLAPVAIAAGITLDRLISALRTVLTPRLFPATALAATCLMLIAFGVSGWQQTDRLVRQFCILDYQTEEPADLIPKLGRAIQAHFSSDTDVLCNFLPDYGPQLAYYAQRNLINNLCEYRFWDPHLNDRTRRVGGVVWLSSSAASQGILAKLPVGPKRFLTVGHLTFCLWRREPVELQMKPAG